MVGSLRGNVCGWKKQGKATSWETRKQCVRDELLGSHEQEKNILKCMKQKGNSFFFNKERGQALLSKKHMGEFWSTG